MHAEEKRIGVDVSKHTTVPGTKPTSPRWLFLMSGCLAIMLVAAACGSDSGDPETGSADGGDAAPADDDLPEDIQEAAATAEEHGLEFVTSREELERLAEEQGDLNVIWSLGDEYEAIQSFIDRYPFLEDRVTLHDLSGNEARERMLLEWEGDAISDLDVNYAATEVYPTFAGEMCDWDVLGMAEAGILDIPVEMIDPNNRRAVASGSTAGALAYNTDVFEGADGPPLPETFDDLVDNLDIYGPEEMRMGWEVNPQNTSALVAAWGLDRTKEFFAKVADDLQPTWAQRYTPVLLQMVQGEYDAMPMTNLHSITREMPEYGGDHDNLGFHLVEPVPVRLSEVHCVFVNEVSNNPHAGLLFLEWTASEEGQAALEIEGDAHQSHYASGYPGGLGELLEGKELSVSDWEHFPEQANYIQELLTVAGFPQPDPDTTG